ncbi:MAG: DUF2000 domain-containing protein [Clostridiales bacterium]|nr:DUF2000 domain-containing protein [Clostridiales bacterium]
MVIDDSQPVGVIANIAAILGVTIGKCRPDVVGRDILDVSGSVHAGIIKFPVPILGSSKEELKQLREKLDNELYAELIVVDFTTLAQGCRTYDEYIEKMEKSDAAELDYIGIAISGDKKKINRLTSMLRSAGRSNNQG